MEVTQLVITFSGSANKSVSQPPAIAMVLSVCSTNPQILDRLPRQRRSFVLKFTLVCKSLVSICRNQILLCSGMSFVRFYTNKRDYKQVNDYHVLTRMRVCERVRVRV